MMQKPSLHSDTWNQNGGIVECAKELGCGGYSVVRLGSAW